MNVELINPFLMAFDNVVQQVINIKSEKGRIYIKEGSQKSGDVVISIGVTGDLSGSVVLNMSEETAKNLASKMMFGMEVKELDDMAKSAISELGNMIAGNSTSFFMDMGKNVNITPPTMYTGKNMSLYTYKAKTVCVPMNIGNETVEIDIALN